MDRHVRREQDDVEAEREDVHADDEYEDDAPRSIFAAGWLRAVLVLIVLAIVTIVAVPYLLDWFGAGPPPATAPARVTKRPEPPATLAPSPESPSAPNVASEPLKPAPQRSPAPTVSGPTTGSTRVETPPLLRAKRTSERPEGVGTRWSSERRRSYWVQVGSFKDAGNAERLARTLKEQGLSAQVTSVTRRGTTGAAEASPGGIYHLVRVGAFPDRQRAVAARDDLQTRGYPGFLTQGVAR